jgi:uncharacterized repeat protein (TIGR04076 family)
MKISMAVVFSLLFALAAYAGQRAANAYHTSKVSNTTVLVSCNDEQEPVVTRLENTTAIVVTCRMQ